MSHMKSFIKRCLRKLLSKLKKQLLKIKKLFANTIFTTQKVACKIIILTDNQILYINLIKFLSVIIKIDNPRVNTNNF